MGGTKIPLIARKVPPPAISNDTIPLKRYCWKLKKGMLLRETQGISKRKKKSSNSAIWSIESLFRKILETSLSANIVQGTPNLGRGGGGSSDSFGISRRFPDFFGIRIYFALKHWAPQSNAQKHRTYCKCTKISRIPKIFACGAWMHLSVPSMH